MIVNRSAAIDPRTAVYSRPILARLMAPERVRRAIALLPPGSRYQILDVGCGRHSASLFHTVYPNASYTGMDSDRASVESEIHLMRRFLEVDLETTEFLELSNDRFDLIVLSHVLEHLRRDPVSVLQRLVGRLAVNGLLYVAFPNKLSVNFPHRQGGLNFNDDPTHVTVVDEDRLISELKPRGVEVVYNSVTRRPCYLALMLVRILFSPITGGVTGPMLWDLYGFERVVIFRNASKADTSGRC